MRSGTKNVGTRLRGKCVNGSTPGIVALRTTRVTVATATIRSSSPNEFHAYANHLGRAPANTRPIAPTAAMISPHPARSAKTGASTPFALKMRNEIPTSRTACMPTSARHGSVSNHGLTATTATTASAMTVSWGPGNGRAAKSQGPRSSAVTNQTTSAIGMVRDGAVASPAVIPSPGSGGLIRVYTRIDRENSKGPGSVPGDYYWGWLNLIPFPKNRGALEGHFGPLL